MNENTRTKLNEARRHLRKITERKSTDEYLDKGDTDALIRKASDLISETLDDKTESEADFMGDSPGQTKMSLLQHNWKEHLKG